MKKTELISIIFERGDYMETPQGFFIYLGNSLWINRDSYTLYQGVYKVAFTKGSNCNLNLRYICEGDVVKHLLKGIPEQKDVYVKQ